VPASVWRFRPVSSPQSCFWRSPSQAADWGEARPHRLAAPQTPHQPHRRGSAHACSGWNQHSLARSAPPRPAPAFRQLAQAPECCLDGPHRAGYATPSFSCRRNSPPPLQLAGRGARCAVVAPNARCVGTCRPRYPPAAEGPSRAHNSRSRCRRHRPWAASPVRSGPRHGKGAPASPHA